MKKKICLLLTLFLSFFVFCGSVEAVKSLGCIYESKDHLSHFLLVQGNSLSLYHKISDHWVFLDVDTQHWADDSDNFEGETSWTIARCPAYIKFEDGSKNELYLSDHDSDGHYASLLESYFSDNEYSHIFIDAFIFYPSQNDIYNKVVDETKWTAECSYSGSTSSDDSIKVYLYFNNNRYILINDTSKDYVNVINFTVGQLNDSFEEYLYNCPSRLYMKDMSLPGTYDIQKNFYLYDPGSGIELRNDDNIVNAYVPEPPTQDEPDEDIDSCAKLFGEDLVKKINDVMDIVKIVVPVLLIVLGIVDFTKAMFSGSSDNMTKSQKTFFKRIVAAILVFIAPIFINLILDIANNVWGDIKSDTCISQNE